MNPLKIGDYEVHAACALLPMMGEVALQELAQDIRENGQQQPVVVFDGKVLDGRNRLRACSLAGISPITIEWTGKDPVRWVMSMNFHRRHLSDDQKSVVGARAEALVCDAIIRQRDIAACDAAKETGADPPPPIMSLTTAERRQVRQDTAALLNVRPAFIQRGRRLIEEAVPELVSAVEDGFASVRQAFDVAQELAPEQQRSLMERGPDALLEEVRRIKEEKAAGTMTLGKGIKILDESYVTYRIEKTDAAHVLCTGQWLDTDGQTHDVELHAGTVRGAIIAAAEAFKQGTESAPISP